MCEAQTYFLAGYLRKQRGGKGSIKTRTICNNKICTTVSHGWLLVNGVWWMMRRSVTKGIREKERAFDQNEGTHILWVSRHFPTIFIFRQLSLFPFWIFSVCICWFAMCCICFGVSFVRNKNVYHTPLPWFLLIPDFWLFVPFVFSPSLSLFSIFLLLILRLLSIVVE